MTQLLDWWESEEHLFGNRIICYNYIAVKERKVTNRIEVLRDTTLARHFSDCRHPHTDDYQLDEESLRREVNWLIDLGVHGLVGPAFASEFMVLADDERRRWIEIMISEADGRVPVIAATHHVHTVPAVALSQHAQSLGADGIMNMPPHVAHLSAEQCFAHYLALSVALDVPVIIQNMVGPIGTPLGSELPARMCREIEHVDYIKEETLPEPRKISETLAAAGDACRGVFGGRNGSHLVDEFLRGACGNMPGAGTPDVHIEIWNKLEAGEEDAARALYNQLLPLYIVGGNYGPLILKEMLHRRGVFATTRSRMPNAQLTAADRREFERVFESIQPLLRA